MNIDSVAVELINELKKRKMTVGCAESCTAGMISSSIADISGASEVLLGGIVSYANEVKTAVLGVPETVLKNYGAVSEECAAHMACGAVKVLGCSVAVSVTGIAGPGGGTPEKPVGTVCFGVADIHGFHTETMHFCETEEHTRTEVRQLTTEHAMKLVLRHIRGEV